MNEAKTIQALQEIFRLRGPEFLMERHQFQSYLEDLLGGGACATERRVFQLALDSGALWPLTKAASISSASAEAVVRQLQTENRMLREDAEFVVRCIAAARGSNVDFSVRQDEERKRLEEEKKRLEEEQKRRNEEWTHLSELRKRREEEARKRDEERRRQEEEARKRDEERRRQQDTVEISCKIKGAKGFLGKRGVLCLYPDSLSFQPNKGINIHLSYSEIGKINTYFFTKWACTLFVIAVFAAIIFWGYLDGWYEASAALVGLGIFEVPLLIFLSWYCNRALLITTKPAAGQGPGGYALTFYSTADKKQAVRYIRSHITR